MIAYCSDLLHDLKATREQSKTLPSIDKETLQSMKTIQSYFGDGLSRAQSDFEALVEASQLVLPTARARMPVTATRRGRRVFLFDVSVPLAVRFEDFDFGMVLEDLSRELGARATFVGGGSDGRTYDYGMEMRASELVEVKLFAKDLSSAAYEWLRKNWSPTLAKSDVKAGIVVEPTDD